MTLLRKLLLGVSVLGLSVSLAVGAPPSSRHTAGTSINDDAQKTLRDTTTILGMFVIAGPDGKQHGMSVDIIAVAPKNEDNAASSINAVGKIGTSMKTSLDEAIRLVKLRDPNASKIHLEISFGEKYSEKDGGSAGAAFTLLMLSSLNHLEIASDMAITGDITVDGKVRQIGGLRAKVHGAAADKLRALIIPAANSSQLAETSLFDGAASLWDIQVLSAATIDDATAIIRKDRDPKLEQSLKLFDELRSSMAKKPITALATNPEAKAKLAKILELAPNHVSAATLQLLADGKGPTKLSLSSSLIEEINALGPLQRGIFIPMTEGPNADASSVTTARSQLEKLKDLVDPTTKDVVARMLEYCDSCDALFQAEKQRNFSSLHKVREEGRQKRDAVRDAVKSLLGNDEAFDKLLRE